MSSFSEWQGKFSIIASQSKEWSKFFLILGFWVRQYRLYFLIILSYAFFRNNVSQIFYFGSRIRILFYLVLNLPPVIIQILFVRGSCDLRMFHCKLLHHLDKPKHICTILNERYCSLHIGMCFVHLTIQMAFYWTQTSLVRKGMLFYVYLPRLFLFANIKL